MSGTVLARVRFRFVILALLALAPAAAAQTVSVSPSSFSQGDESFLQISLAGLLSTDYALVTFTGPGGNAALEPQFIVDGVLIVWVPERAMNNPGIYTVDVDVTRNGTTTRYGPAQITVQALASTFPPSLTLPEVVTAEAVTAAGAVVTFSATASDGASVACMPSSGSIFPLGTSSVSCSSANASGSFSVFVYDTGSPVLTVPATSRRPTRSSRTA